MRCPGFRHNGWLVTMLAAGLLMFRTSALSAVGKAAPENEASPSELEQARREIDVLRREIAELKGKATDQAHTMTDVDYHFANLWFAARAENWPLAEFYWKETVSHMKWAVRVIPVRKDNAGREIKLEEILQSIEQSPYMQVGKTIENKQMPEFEIAYRHVLEGCYSCHKAADKPYLRPRIPERPASAIMNFSPTATWPQ